MAAISRAGAGFVAGLVICGLIAFAFAASDAQAARSCKPVRAGEDRYKIRIERGTVSCSRARRVMRAFLQGKGTLHGPANGPAYKQTWTLRGGWSCGHGTGGGGCIRGGTDYTNARDYVLASAIY